MTCELNMSELIPFRILFLEEVVVGRGVEFCCTHEILYGVTSAAVNEA